MRKKMISLMMTVAMGTDVYKRQVFTSHMKVSPLEYINSVRIHTACEFLQKTDCLLYTSYE